MAFVSSISSRARSLIVDSKCSTTSAPISVRTMSDLTFITGPSRSGKSRRAVEQAARWGGDTVYVATYRADAGDVEMTERVRRHRAERPAWRALKAPADVAAALMQLSPAPSGVILDCLTLWLGARFDDSDEAIVRA